MSQRNNSPDTFQRVFLLILFFLPFYGLWDPLFAEQRLDSEDQLSVDRFTARERVKSGYIMDALKAEQDALQVQEYRDGPIHPSLALILDDLSTLDRYLARYAEAESRLKWALAIQEKAFGPNNNLVAQSQYQLASLYLDWGHWGEADFYENRVLLTLEYNQSHASILNTWLPNFIRFVKTLAPKQAPRQQAQNQAENSSLPLWQAYSLMGQIQMGLQSNKESLSYLQKSLEAEQKDPGRTPAGHINLLELMAENYLLLQQPSDAQSCLEEVLNTAKTSFKANSIEVADAMERLGVFYRSQKLEDKAKPLLSFARNIYRGCVGTYFGYSSIPYVQKLAKADESLGQFNEALDLLQKNIQSAREAFGANHPRVAVGLMDLANAEKALGQDAIAQKNFKQALKIAQSFYGEDFPLVLKIQKQIHP